MAKSIFVTGITGKSGAYMLEEIARADNDELRFTFLVRSREKAEGVVRRFPKANICIGDCDDLDFIRREFATGHYDTLFHIVGIERSVQMVEAAIAGGVKWLVLVHTTGIYSKYKANSEVYKQIEAKIDRMIAGTDIRKTILRPTMIYGNLTDGTVAVFMNMVHRLRLFPVIDHARYPLQPVWCGDLGKAYFHVIECEEVTKVKIIFFPAGALSCLSICSKSWSAASA